MLVVSICLNAILLGLVIYMYVRLSNNQENIFVEGQAFLESEKIGHEQYEIGPWGPPVEEMKKHVKW